jgi:Ca2+-binding EF-hand superfamily protein
MDRNQFISYFGQCDNVRFYQSKKEHLNAVFDLIDNDRSENISKKELTAMNAKYNIGLSPN